MKQIFTLFLILFSLSTYSQTYKYVVAKNGLNLRSEPSTNSDIIKSIPFFEKIYLLDSCNTPLDTLDNYFDNGANNELYQRFVIGQWFLAIHNGDTGYVNDAYTNWIRNRYRKDSLNLNYGITLKGSNCFDNIHRNKYIVWKGLYKTEKGYEIKDVEIDYFQDRGDLTGFTTKVIGDKNLLICLGSDNSTFYNGSIEGTYYDHNEGLIFNSNTSKSNFPFFEVEKSKEGDFLILKMSGLTQKIVGNGPRKLIWKGDLDYDSVDDYIILFGEKSSNMTLFLSTEAKKGQIVAPVATYISGYCC